MKSPLVIALLLFGVFSVFGFAATQSLLPRLVPRARLVAANARLDQSDATATTLGPALGGSLTGLLGAPEAIAADATENGVFDVNNPAIHNRSSTPGSRSGYHIVPLALA